jgi:hypothetical protein
MRQDQREGIVGAGLDGREDVGEREAPVGDASWPLAAPPPDMARSPFLSDARLVLKEETYALFSSTAE